MDDLPSLEFPPSRRGGPTCRAGELFLHSSYSPEKEAEKTVSGLGQRQALVLIGCGLGYILRSWAAITEGAPVLVIEWDRRILERCESEFPGTLTLPGVTLVREIPRSGDFMNWLEGIDTPLSGELGILEIPAYRSLYPETMTTVRQALTDALQRVMGNRFTEWEFERIWARNIIRNIPALLEARPYSDYSGSAGDRGAVLVGAGPSLASELDFIRDAAGFAALFATDTALPTLAASGITPDWIVSLDGQIHNRKDFNGIDTSGSGLLAEMTVYPDIPAGKFRETAFFEAAALEEQDGRILVHSHPLCLWVKQCTGEAGPVATGGNVLTAALSLAVGMGYRIILFSGMDNSFPGMQYHTRGAASHTADAHRQTRINTMEKLGASRVRRRKLRYLGDNTGNDVATDPVLLRYAEWTGESLAGFQDLTVATISPRGLAVAGLPLIDPAGALSLLGRHRKRAMKPRGGGFRTTGSKALVGRLEELLAALERTASDPAPENEALPALIECFPFINRIFSKQLLYVNRKSDNREQAAAFLRAEIRLEMKRMCRYVRLTLGEIRAGEKA